MGGCIIAAGHFSMAVPSDVTFFLGLGLIIIGTGLLKPNVSTVVGELYPEGGARRDAGFSVFYMGINIGAFMGPLITGFLGEGYHWHWGFSAAGVGMVLGLIQYKKGATYLGEAGLLKTSDTPEVVAHKTRIFFGGFFALVGAILAFGFLVSTQVIPLTLTEIARYLGYSVLVLVAIYFVYLWTAGGHTSEENKRLGVIFWLFLLVAVFWSGFEQAGSSLNLFAAQLTERDVLGWEMPASFLQSVNPILIILMAPLFGALWVWLEKRNADPSIPVKAALGLLGLAMGFFVLSWGAANATPGNLVSPSWLVVTYFLHTCGELAISPVGLSAITKLSPTNRVGQMMGIWFVGAALGNLFAAWLPACWNRSRLRAVPHRRDDHWRCRAGRAAREPCGEAAPEGSGLTREVRFDRRPCRGPWRWAPSARAEAPVACGRRAGGDVIYYPDVTVSYGPERGGRAAQASLKKTFPCHESLAGRSHSPARSCAARVTVPSKTIVSGPTLPLPARPRNPARSTLSTCPSCRYQTGLPSIRLVPSRSSNPFRTLTMASIEHPTVAQFARPHPPGGTGRSATPGRTSVESRAPPTCPGSRRRSRVAPTPRSARAYVLRRRPTRGRRPEVYRKRPWA